MYQLYTKWLRESTAHVPLLLVAPPLHDVPYTCITVVCVIKSEDKCNVFVPLLWRKASDRVGVASQTKNYLFRVPCGHYDQHIPNKSHMRLFQQVKTGGLYGQGQLQAALGSGVGKGFKIPKFDNDRRTWNTVCQCCVLMSGRLQVIAPAPTALVLTIS